MARSLGVMTELTWRQVEESWPKIRDWMKEWDIEPDSVREITVQQGLGQSGDFDYYIQIKTYLPAEDGGWIESVHHHPIPLSTPH